MLAPKLHNQAAVTADELGRILTHRVPLAGSVRAGIDLEQALPGFSPQRLADCLLGGRVVAPTSEHRAGQHAGIDAAYLPTDRHWSSAARALG